MDSTQYTFKLGDLLEEDNYRLLPRKPTPRIEKQVTDALNTVERDGNLTDEMKKMLTPRQSSSPQIYRLPNIHKEGDHTTPLCAQLVPLWACQGADKDPFTTHRWYQFFCDEFNTLG